jgi:hypothetical protein
MTTTPSRRTSSAPTREVVTYQVLVAGHLDDHWSDWLGGHALTHNDDSTTTLTLMAVDQTQLHGVLAGVRDLGVDLLELHRVGNAPAGAVHPPNPAAPDQQTQ